jgi:hypothetical protein
MAMLDEALLRRTFRDTLLGVSTIPDERTMIAWENEPFDPPQMVDVGPAPLWVKEHVRVLNESKSSTGFVEAVGETLYSVETPKNRGTEEADALAKAIAEALQAGNSLTATGLTVILEQTERRPYREDPNHPAWVFKTVACRWRTFTDSES